MVTLTYENETGESDAVTLVAFTGTVDVVPMLSSGQTPASVIDDNRSRSFGNKSNIATTEDDNSDKSSPASNARDDSGI
ncbi:MAG TPA: hypothetical protein VF172_00405 [Nitrososphaera sp.]